MGIFGWSYPPGAADDPMAPYNQDSDCCEDFDELLCALKDIDEGRWEWDGVDCSWTGKDADLDSCGHQGVSVVTCDDEGAKCCARLSKTACGNDVALNTPEGLDEDDKRYFAARERYMEKAELVVQGCSVGGEWDGDDWVLGASETFSVEWQGVDQDGVPDYAATAALIAQKAQEALKPAVDEIGLLDDLLDQLAGWKDGEGHQCNPGEPSKLAAWLGGEE